MQLPQNDYYDVERKRRISPFEATNACKNLQRNVSKTLYNNKFILYTTPVFINREYLLTKDQNRNNISGKNLQDHPGQTNI